jgi:hypothetical protein
MSPGKRQGNRMGMPRFLKGQLWARRAKIPGEEAVFWLKSQT